MPDYVYRVVPDDGPDAPDDKPRLYAEPGQAKADATYWNNTAAFYGLRFMYRVQRGTVVWDEEKESTDE
jgi:hypothetical protein